jgi:predicted PurR-regulated permease PerM
MEPHNLNESVAGKMIVATIVLAGLYIGRDLLVPIALAILLSFVLAPLVRPSALARS